METIKIDCPHCSMDHGITLIPGLQQHTCFNCNKRYVVVIDNYGSVNIRREANIPESPYCHDLFMEQLTVNLDKDKWQIMQGHSKSIDLVAKKDNGIGWPIHFLGHVNAERIHSFDEMRHVFDEFHDFIVQNTDYFDVLHSFSGLLLFSFSNVYHTNLDDECRSWIRRSQLKRLIVSAAAFDFSTESYFSSMTNHGHEWNSVVPHLLNPIDLQKCHQ